jgi:small subunit ribosomal protein S18
MRMQRNSFSSSSPSGSDRPSGPGGRDRKPGGAGGGRFFTKTKKFCRFCKENIAHVDYKNADLLRGFVPERAKIQPRRLSGTCAAHQRMVTQAIKRARHLALLPFQSD